MKRKRRKKKTIRRRIWIPAGQTKQGRKKSLRHVRMTSAMGGVASWFARRGVADIVREEDRRRYHYEYRVQFRYRFVGERRVYKGELLIEEQPEAPGKRVHLGKGDSFKGTRPFRRSLNQRTWAAYRRTVTALFILQNAHLKTGSGGKKLQRNKRSRIYAEFDLGLVVERTERKLPKKRRKKR